MTDDEMCPLCNADLRGAPIPEEHLTAGYYGEWDGPRHFSRKIGVEVQGAYDGVLYWTCPDCGGNWHRFPEDSRQYAAALRYMAPQGAP